MNIANAYYRTTDFLRRIGALSKTPRESHPLIERYLSGEAENVQFYRGLSWARPQGEWGQHPEQDWQRYRNDEEKTYEAPLPLNAKWNGTQYEIDVYQSVSKYCSALDFYVETEVWIGRGRNIHAAPLWGWGDGAPPEYDVAELYSDDEYEYSCQSNYHHGDNYEEDKQSIKGAKHAFYPEERNLYGALFEDGVVTFFYNRHPVRQVKAKDVNKFSDYWNVIVQAGMKEQSVFTKDDVEGVLYSAKVYKDNEYSPLFESADDFIIA